MRKRATLAVLLIAAVAAGGLASKAEAVEITKTVSIRQEGLSSGLGQEVIRTEVDVDVPAPDEDDDGIDDREDPCIGYCPPPAPAPVAEPAPEPAAPATGCTGMEAESGTDGYSAYNASSDAEGCYQIIPETEDYYGCELSTPGGQDACMLEICGDVGNQAWAASGATPCG